MCELFHEKVPFDGDITACTRFVTQENVRPKIEEHHDEEEIDYEASQKSN